MTEGLSILITYRGRLKGFLTKLLSFAEGPPEDFTLVMVMCWLERLETVQGEFLKPMNDIYVLSNQEDFVDPEVDFVTYKEKYLAPHGEFQSLKTKDGPKPDEHENNAEAIKKQKGHQIDFLQKSL